MRHRLDLYHWSHLKRQNSTRRQARQLRAPGFSPLCYVNQPLAPVLATQGNQRNLQPQLRFLQPAARLRPSRHMPPTTLSRVAAAATPRHSLISPVRSFAIRVAGQKASRSKETSGFIRPAATASPPDVNRLTPRPTGVSQEQLS